VCDEYKASGKTLPAGIMDEVLQHVRYVSVRKFCSLVGLFC